MLRLSALDSLPGTYALREQDSYRWMKISSRGYPSALRTPKRRPPKPGQNMNPWLRKSSSQDIPGQLKKLLHAGYLAGEHTSVIVHDFDLMQARLAQLRDAFPPDTLHAIAVKANPVLEVLREVVKNGFGLETASLPETQLALAAGCSPRRIVFDSPAKTHQELAYALRRGFVINANSYAELDRLESLGASGRMGLRCNPAVADITRDTATMVAVAGSKFGVPMEGLTRELQRRPWVNGLHVHVGSQVAGLEDLVEAVRRIVAVALQSENIRWIDIGGGLPTRYRDVDPGLSPHHYVAALRREVPELFDYPLITEIGRAVQVGCGWAVSQVEYVEDGRAVLHFGADLAPREAYQPDDWWHDFSVYTSDGSPKEAPEQEYSLYGPLCFSGDRLVRSRGLPKLVEGDLVVMHDVGGYTLSMWSRYCSRAMPEVVGFQNGAPRVLRPRESADDLVRFWSNK